MSMGVRWWALSIQRVSYIPLTDLDLKMTHGEVGVRTLRIENIGIMETEIGNTHWGYGQC
jgi:hypothetical protein